MMAKPTMDLPSAEELNAAYEQINREGLQTPFNSALGVQVLFDPTLSGVVHRMEQAAVGGDVQLRQAIAGAVMLGLNIGLRVGSWRGGWG